MRPFLVLVTLVCGLGLIFAKQFDTDRPISLLASNTPVNDAGQAPIGRKHTLSRRDDGHFYVTANVEGRPVDFVVDTGASHLMLTKDDATRLGRFITDKELVHEFHTANGVNYAAKIKLATMRIGDKDFANVDAFVLPKGLSVSLLGQSVLQRFTAVEMRQSTMELRW